MHGDSTAYGGGTAGNKGSVSLDYQSTDGGSGNWGHDYAGELNITKTAGEATRDNNNARNFGAIKFTQSGTNTTFARHSTNTVGGTFGVLILQLGVQVVHHKLIYGQGMQTHLILVYYLLIVVIMHTQAQ